MAIGPRDLENQKIEVSRRDTLEKESIDFENIENITNNILEEIQNNLFQKALKFREENTHHANSYDEFKDLLKNKQGFVYAHWDGTEETEAKIKTETKATIRCIPIDNKKEEGKCVYSGKPSKQKVLFAKSY